MVNTQIWPKHIHTDIQNSTTSFLTIVNIRKKNNIHIGKASRQRSGFGSDIQTDTSAPTNEHTVIIHDRMRRKKKQKKNEDRKQKQKKKRRQARLRPICPACQLSNINRIIIERWWSARKEGADGTGTPLGCRFRLSKPTKEWKKSKGKNNDSSEKTPGPNPKVNHLDRGMKKERRMSTRTQETFTAFHASWQRQDGSCSAPPG